MGGAIPLLSAKSSWLAQGHTALNVTGTVTAQAQLTNYVEQSLGSQQFLS